MKLTMDFGAKKNRSHELIKRSFSMENPKKNYVDWRRTSVHFSLINRLLNSFEGVKAKLIEN